MRKRSLLILVGLSVLAVSAPFIRLHDIDKEQAFPIIERGIASFYSNTFQGRLTANGDRHDQQSLTAASKELPLGSKATVTNLSNGRSVDVEVNDRGPYVGGRIIDLSKRAAEALGITGRQGIAHVEVTEQPATQPTPELKDKVAEIGLIRSGAKKARAGAVPEKRSVSASSPNTQAAAESGGGAASRGEKPARDPAR